MLKILYFIDGNCATPAQVHDAKTIPAKVQFRNAQVVPDALEKADGVAGAVPEIYQHYPSVEQALSKQKSDNDKETKQLAKKANPKAIPDEKKEKVEKPKVSDSKEFSSTEKKAWGGK